MSNRILRIMSTNMVTHLVLKTSMTHLNFEGSSMHFVREYY